MPVLDTPRAKLLLAGRWPAHAGGELSAAQRRLCDADRIRACLVCGGPVLVPDGRVRGYEAEQAALPPGMRYVPDDLAPIERWCRNGWEIHPDCHAGVDRWGACWPVIAAASVLDRPPGRLPRPLDRRLAAELAAACRPCTDCPPPQREPRLVVPLFVNIAGTAARRPVRPWSHLDAPAHDPGAWHWPHPKTGELVEASALPVRPSHRDVIGAELADARRRLHWSTPVPPSARFPDAGDACWWCGIGRAPRRSWELADGGAWCGQQDVCPPPIVGNRLANRAQIVGQLFDEPYDLGRVRQTDTMRRLPVVVWGELPEAERVPQDRAFGWLDEATLSDLRALFDAFEANDEYIADRMARTAADRRAADAHRAQMDAIRAEALEEARQEAQRIASEQPAAREPTLAETIGAEVGKAIAPRIGAEFIKRNAERRRAAERAPRL